MTSTELKLRLEISYLKEDLAEATLERDSYSDLLTLSELAKQELQEELKRIKKQ